MSLTKLPIKPSVSMNRSTKIDRFFKSKKRFIAQGFLEILFKIKIVGGTTKTEWGYSQEFAINNNAQYRQAIEDNYLNALAKVMYREGFLFEGSDDIQSIDDSDVQSVEMIDYFIYYPNFKDEQTVRINRKRKDGSISRSIRFRKNGKFIKGGGLENPEKDIATTRSNWSMREESYSKTRDQANERANSLELARKYK